MKAVITPLVCHCLSPEHCRLTGFCMRLVNLGVFGIGAAPSRMLEVPEPPTTAAPVDPTGKQGRGGLR